MKKKKIILLVIPVVCVVIIAFLLFGAVNNKVEPTTVYVFTHNITANTLITEDDVDEISIPADAVMGNFMLTKNTEKNADGSAKNEGIIGSYTLTDAYEGQVIIKDMVGTKTEIDPFKTMDMTQLRKISLQVSYDTAFGGNMKRGDQIDLVYTGAGTKTTTDQNGSQMSSDFLYSKVFMQGLYVYSVTTDDGYAFADHSQISDAEQTDGSGEKISTTSSSGDIAVVTFLVTLEQAEEIETRLAGGDINILGRVDGSEDYSSLGFVLGDFEKIYAGQTNAEISTNNAPNSASINVTNSGSSNSAEDKENN